MINPYLASLNLCSRVVGNSSAVAREGGEQLHLWGLLKQGDNLSPFIEKGVFPDIPDGITCLFDQCFCSAPTAEKLFRITASFLKCGQLFGRHEPGGKSAHGPRANLLHIHAYGGMVKRHA